MNFKDEWLKLADRTKKLANSDVAYELTYNSTSFKSKLYSAELMDIFNTAVVLLSIYKCSLELQNDETIKG